MNNCKSEAEPHTQGTANIAVLYERARHPFVRTKGLTEPSPLVNDLQEAILADKARELP